MVKTIVIKQRSHRWKQGGNKIEIRRNKYQDDGDDDKRKRMMMMMVLTRYDTDTKALLRATRPILPTTFHYDALE